MIGDVRFVRQAWRSEPVLASGEGRWVQSATSAISLKVMSGLDIECLDRLYLNGRVPKLQAGGQVIRFMRDHLGYPVPSPAIFEQLGTPSAPRCASAEANKIPLIHFTRGSIGTST